MLLPQIFSLRLFTASTEELPCAPSRPFQHTFQAFVTLHISCPLPGMLFSSLVTLPHSPRKFLHNFQHSNITVLTFLGRIRLLGFQDTLNISVVLHLLHLQYVHMTVFCCCCCLFVLMEHLKANSRHYYFNLKYFSMNL